MLFLYMTDTHTKEQRSYNMSRIKGKDTKPEIIVRRWLWNNGYRYRIHRKDLPGKPDIVFPGRKKIIFINGCFWHKHDCKSFKWPTSNTEYWSRKIERNTERDAENCSRLISGGWDFIIIWECELKKKDLTSVWKRITKFLSE